MKDDLTDTTEENLAALSESLRGDELLISKGKKISLFAKEHWRFVLKILRSIDFSAAMDSFRARVETLLAKIEMTESKSV